MADPVEEKISHADLLQMTAQVVSAYVGNNNIADVQLPEIIRSVYGSLTLLEGAGAGEVVPEQKPAVPVKRSITPDYIVCLEDGKKLKMLKRHLRTTYNLTPDEYRAKWGLAADYPMVAPNYAKQRSAFAKKIGLGKRTGPRRRK
jgi:predicted transcriptional regulator